MADFFPGSIQIGGTIPRKLALKLFSIIKEGSLSLDSGNDLATPRTIGDLMRFSPGLKPGRYATAPAATVSIA